MCSMKCLREKLIWYNWYNCIESKLCCFNWVTIKFWCMTVDRLAGHLSTWMIIKIIQFMQLVGYNIILWTFRSEIDDSNLPWTVQKNTIKIYSTDAKSSPSTMFSSSLITYKLTQACDTLISPELKSQN